MRLTDYSGDGATCAPHEEPKSITDYDDSSGITADEIKAFWADVSCMTNDVRKDDAYIPIAYYKVSRNPFETAKSYLSALSYVVGAFFCNLFTEVYNAYSRIKRRAR